MNRYKPIFTLPPFTVEKVMTTFAQSKDWGLVALNVPDTWKVTKGANVTVLVLDTGCPATKTSSGVAIHPDLKNNIIINKCKSFVAGEDIYDYNGHSSMCCGIIGGEDNEIGYVGYAPECRLITYKVLGRNGSGSINSIENALRDAIKLRPDIVSMSLGATVSTPEIEKCIKILDSMNIPVICEAGNGGAAEGVNYPAKHAESFAIAAYDAQFKIANFSAVGPEVDFAFPGVNIVGTYLNNGYATMNGTSFACPACAGVVALMLSKHKKQFIETGKNDCITTWDVYDHLKKYSINKDKPGTKDDKWGWGMIDVSKLILEDGSTTNPTAPKPNNATKASSCKLKSFVLKLIDWLSTYLHK